MGSRSPDTPEPPRPPGKKAPPQSLRCKVRVGRGPLRRGTAALAESALHFHTGRTGREGQDFVLHLPFDEITAVHADGPAGTLAVSTAESGEVVFHLGRTAVAWKQIIDERPDLLRELGVAPRARVALVGVDDERLEQALGERARGEAGDGLDALFAGAEHRADLERLASLARRLRPGGVLWVVFPAGSRAVAHDEIVTAGRAAGLIDGRTVELSPGRLALRLSRG